MQVRVSRLRESRGESICESVLQKLRFAPQRTKRKKNGRRNKTANIEHRATRVCNMYVCIPTSMKQASNGATLAHLACIAILAYHWRSEANILSTLEMADKRSRGNCYSRLILDIHAMSYHSTAVPRHPSDSCHRWQWLCVSCSYRDNDLKCRQLSGVANRKKPSAYGALSRSIAIETRARIIPRFEEKKNGRNSRDESKKRYEQAAKQIGRRTGT